MSDARRQELERLAASGDPEARRALFSELARSGDAGFRAALELRQALRLAFFGALDAAQRSSFAPFPPLLSVLREGLGGDANEAFGFAWREVAAGPWFFAGRGRIGVLVVRREERVRVGVGIARADAWRPFLPSALWEGLKPWRSNARPATQARKLEAWIESGDVEWGRLCAGAQVIDTSLSAARELCRLADYAGPRGHSLWASVDAAPARMPVNPDHEEGPTQADARRLRALAEGYPETELRAIALVHFGHAGALSRPEAKHLVALLQAWSGSGETLSPEERLRVGGIWRRLGLDGPEGAALLREVAGVERLEQVPQARAPALLQRLRALERVSDQERSRAPAEATGPLEEAEPWIEVPLDDAAFARDLAQRDDPLPRRRLGAQWSRRVLPRARYADLPPLAGPPRERWRVQLTRRVDLQRILAASPLGVAVATTRCVHLLDADTGALRAELPAAKAAWQVAEVLVLALSKRELAGYDLWTGAELYRTKLKAPSVEQGHVVEDLFVSFRGRYGLLFSDPRQPPEPGWGVAAVRDAPLSAQPPEVRFVLERFYRCDAAGSVHVSERYREAGYFDEPGRHEARWWLPQPNVAVALTPDFVVQRHIVGHLSALDRASGEERVALLSDHHGVYSEGVWVSRDTVYVPSERRERCLGIGLRDGAERWQHAPEGAKGRARIAPGWGRVYLIGKREALCLESAEA